MKFSVSDVSPKDITVEYEMGEVGDKHTYSEPVGSNILLDYEEGYLVLERGRDTVEAGFPEQVYEDNLDSDSYIVEPLIEGEDTIFENEGSKLRIGGNIRVWKELNQDTIPVGYLVKYHNPDPTKLNFHFMFGVTKDSNGDLSTPLTIYFLTEGEHSDSPKVGIARISNLEFAMFEYHTAIPIFYNEEISQTVECYIEIRDRLIGIYIKYEQDTNFRHVLSGVIDKGPTTAHFGWATSTADYDEESYIDILEAKALFQRPEEFMQSDISNYNPFYDVNLYRSGKPEATLKTEHRKLVPFSGINFTNVLTPKGVSKELLESIREKKPSDFRSIEIDTGLSFIRAGMGPILMRLVVKDEFGSPVEGEKVELNIAGGGFLSSPFERRPSGTNVIVETGKDGMALFNYTPPLESEIVVGTESEGTYSEFYYPDLKPIPDNQKPIFRNGAYTDTVQILKSNLTNAEIVFSSSIENSLPGVNSWDVYWSLTEFFGDNTDTLITPLEKEGNLQKFAKDSLDNAAENSMLIYYGDGSFTIPGDGILKPVSSLWALNSKIESYYDDGKNILISGIDEGKNARVLFRKKVAEAVSESSLKMNIEDRICLVKIDRLCRINAKGKNFSKTMEVCLTSGQTVLSTGENPVKNLRLTVEPPEGLSGSIGDGLILRADFDTAGGTVNYYSFDFFVDGYTGNLNEFEPTGKDQKYTNSKFRYRDSDTEKWVSATGNLAHATVPVHSKVAFIWPNDNDPDHFSGTNDHLQENSEYSATSGAGELGFENLSRGMLDDSTVYVTVRSHNSSGIVIGTSTVFLKVPNYTPPPPPVILEIPKLIEDITIHSFHNRGYVNALRKSIGLRKGLYEIKAISGAGASNKLFQAGLISFLGENKFEIGDLGRNFYGEDETSYDEASQALENRKVLVSIQEDGTYDFGGYFPDNQITNQGKNTSRYFTLTIDYTELTSFSSFTINGNDHEFVTFSFNVATPLPRRIPIEASAMEQMFAIATKLRMYFGSTVKCVYSEDNPDTITIIGLTGFEDKFHVSISGPGITIVENDEVFEQGYDPKVNLQLSLVSQSLATSEAGVIYWYTPEKTLPGGIQSLDET